VGENQKEQDAVDGHAVRSESKKPHATRRGRRGTVSISVPAIGLSGGRGATRFSSQVTFCEVPGSKPPRGI
jgi:hypothetical protein